MKRMTELTKTDGQLKKDTRETDRIAQEVYIETCDKKTDHAFVTRKSTRRSNRSLTQR